MKKKIKNEKGQAVMEFLAFVPFMLGMLTIYLKVGSAINGSINQQKAVRRFFYHLEKGNAFTPTAPLLFNADYINKQFAHYSAVGWAEELRGNNPFAPCYAIPTFFQPPVDACDDPKEGETKTSFIKVYTAYGICGGHFQKNPNANMWVLSWENASSGACGLSN